MSTASSTTIAPASSGSLPVPPLGETQELLKHPTGLKGGGLLLNVVIVGYLIIRLVQRRHGTPRQQPR